MPSEAEHSSPAEQKGFITVSSSIPEGGVVKYLLIEPHGSANLEPFPQIVRKHLVHDEKVLHDYLQMEKDKGASELSREILRNLPGGIAVNVEVARGVLDLNRIPQRTINYIVDSHAPEEVFKTLLDIYHSILKAIADIIAALPPEARIICLHTMKANTRERASELFRKLTFDTAKIREYLDECERSIRPTEELGIDILTGPKGEEDLADLQMRDALVEAFNRSGIKWQANFPYATEYNLHKTTDYMLARPGHTICLDTPKHLLCDGSIQDKSFSYIRSQAEPAKVQKIAAVMAAAIKSLTE